MENSPEAQSALQGEKVVYDDRTRVADALDENGHEYAVITTQEGHRIALHFDPDDYAKFERALVEDKEAFVSIGNLATGSRFMFNGNISIVETYTPTRFAEMMQQAQANEEAEREAALQMATRRAMAGGAARMIVPGPR